MSNLGVIKPRLVSYRSSRGISAGLVLNDTIFDFAGIPAIAKYESVLALLNDWDSARSSLESAAATASRENLEGTPVERADLLAPVLYPSAIYCAGINYADHVVEMDRAANRAPDADLRSSLGFKPWHFLKASRTAVGPKCTIQLPAGSQKVDWEAELAAVIGRKAKRVPVTQALDYVAGYMAANDLSARDLGKRLNMPPASAFRHDWIGQKSFDGSCPLGPWIVPANEIPDPQNLAIQLRVNGVLKQDSNTANMIFTLAEQTAQLSSNLTLYPGDVILTGTPAGTGAGRGEFLRSGDVVEVSIQGVGTLMNRME